jgi:hypothetical protein
MYSPEEKLIQQGKKNWYSGISVAESKLFTAEK